MSKATLSTKRLDPLPNNQINEIQTKPWRTSTTWRACERRTRQWWKKDLYL